MKRPDQSEEATVTESVADLIRETDAALEAARDARRKLRRREREVDREIQRLARERAALAVKTRQRAPAQSLVNKAGRAAVERVAATVREHGSIRQADVSRVTGLNDGVVSAAIRALVEQGKIERTGERVGRSYVYRTVRARRRARATVGSAV